MEFDVPTSSRSRDIRVFEKKKKQKRTRDDTIANEFMAETGSYDMIKKDGVSFEIAS